MNVHHVRPGSVHYPQMERQDLTQSQLGSFKFVPTDATSLYPQNLSTILENNSTGPILQERPVLNPHMDPGLPRRRRKNSNSRQNPLLKSPVTVNDIHLVHNPLLSPRYHYNMATQLIPDDSTMPSRGNSPQRFDHRLLRGLVDQQQNYSWSPTHQYRTHGVNDTSRRTVLAPTYPESVSEARNGQAEAIQMSLIRALSAEQDAHSLTKSELIRLQAQYAGLETQFENTASQNRSLLGSVNMLKSLVQHSVNKERSPISSPVPQSARQVVDQHASTNTSGNAVDEGTLLHDAIERQKHRYDNQRRQWDDALSPHNRHVGLVSAPNEDLVVKDLDLALSSINPNRFYDAVNGARSRQPFAAPSDRSELLLDHLSSPVSNGTRESVFPQQFSSLDKSMTIGEPFKMVGGLGNAVNREATNISKTSLLDSVIYGGKALSLITCSSTSSESSDRPLRDGVDFEPSQTDAKCLTSEFPSTEKGMPMPYDPDIRWTVTGFNPIFEDEADKYNHLGPACRADFRDTYFWQYPVRYTPEENETNLYRTVMMDFLPEATEYLDILETIRGGSLESIQLFDRLPGCTTFKTARIVFNYELGARALYMRGQTPGISIKGQRLRVWQVLQPTYPKNKKLEVDVFERGCTRLLIMDNISHDTVLKLPQKLKPLIKAGFLIEIAHTAHGGLPVIEFTSVESAVRAFDDLMHDNDFAGVKFDFEPDQCEEPYENGHGALDG